MTGQPRGQAQPVVELLRVASAAARICAPSDEAPRRELERLDWNTRVRPCNTELGKANLNGRSRLRNRPGIRNP
jgi:hypothetical protein